MTIFRGVKREGRTASNIADFERWGIINPKWQGIWAIHTESGGDCLLLTTGGLCQGQIDELRISIGEAFARYARRAAAEEPTE